LAGALGFFFRAPLESYYRAHLDFYVRAGAKEARSSGLELAYQSGALERPQAPTRHEGISSARLEAPDAARRSAQPGPGRRRGFLLPKEQGGAQGVLPDMNSPWIARDEAVSFWRSSTGIGVKWSAGFSIFFFLLGTFLFRIERKYKQIEARKHPKRWR
jgi:hypothetical protein